MNPNIPFSVSPKLRPITGLIILLIIFFLVSIYFINVDTAPANRSWRTPLAFTIFGIIGLIFSVGGGALIGYRLSRSFPLLTVTEEGLIYHPSNVSVAWHEIDKVAYTLGDPILFQLKYVVISLTQDAASQRHPRDASQLIDLSFASKDDFLVVKDHIQHKVNA